MRHLLNHLEHKCKSFWTDIKILVCMTQWYASQISKLYLELSWSVKESIQFPYYRRKNIQTQCSCLLKSEQRNNPWNWLSVQKQFRVKSLFYPALLDGPFWQRAKMQCSEKITNNPISKKIVTLNVLKNGGGFPVSKAGEAITIIISPGYIIQGGPSLVQINRLVQATMYIFSCTDSVVAIETNSF